jgi:hypothetical protein
MIKLWKFVPILIVLAVCLALTLGPVAATASAAGGIGIEVQPQTTKVGFGENFSVEIWINDTVAQDYNAVGVRLVYETKYVRATNVIDNGLWDYVVDHGNDTINNTWSSTHGLIKFDATMLGPGNNFNTSQLAFTVNFTSTSNVSNSGISGLDFIFIPLDDATSVPDAGVDQLDWDEVVNGTVQVGVPPGISVSPHKLTFSAIEEGEKPPAQTLDVCNLGNGTLSWSLSDTAGWLSETPVGGSLGEGECEDVTVSVDVTGMEAGDYSATITITGSAEVEIPVSLHIESATVPIPGGPANLSASSLSISPQQVKPGEEVTISINLANTGGETGDYSAVLYINEEIEDSQTVSVAAGASKSVTFTVSKAQAGVYQVSLGGQSGQFEVVSAGWSGGGLGTGGIIAIVVAVIAVIVALFFILRRTRREI